jgi:hypothetical protein
MGLNCLIQSHAVFGHCVGLYRTVILVVRVQECPQAERFQNTKNIATAGTLNTNVSGMSIMLGSDTLVHCIKKKDTEL